MRIISILLFLLPISLYSQTPGYLGKKVFVGYDFNFLPVLNGVMPNPGYPINQFVIFSFKHEAKIGITFSKKGQCSFSYLRQNNVANYSYANFASWSVSKKYNNFYNTIFALNFKFQLGNFISPVGAFIELSCGYGKAGLMDNDAFIARGNPDELNGKGSYLTYQRISISLGTTKMLSKSLYFNYGLRFNLNFNQQDFVNTSVNNSSKLVLRFVQEELRNMNWLEGKIGFGILL